MEIFNAIVLKSVDYKDNDKVLTLFSAERGKITANAKGVKKAGAKLTFCAQPFCFAEYVMAEKNGRFTVTQGTLYDSFFNVAADLEKYYAGIVVLEYANAFVLEGEEESELFALTINTLKTLAYENVAPKIVLAKFLLDALKVCGFEFVTDSCRNCGKDITQKVYLDEKSGECLCENCKKEKDVEFNIKTYNFVNELSKSRDLTGLRCDELGQRKALRLFSYYMYLNTETRLETLEKIIRNEF